MNRDPIFTEIETHQGPKADEGTKERVNVTLMTKLHKSIDLEGPEKIADALNKHFLQRSA